MQTMRRTNTGNMSTIQQQIRSQSTNGSNLNNSQSQQNSSHLLQADNEFKCNIKDHQRERIEFICVQKDCTAENRLCCTFCKQLYHGGHSKEKVIKLKDFSQKVIIDSEKLTKRFEEMVEENDIRLIFQQRIQKTIQYKLDEIVKQFQRAIKLSRERISLLIEAASSQDDIYEQGENEDICNDINEFNSDLYKVLHRNYKLHSKEDIEMLTKIYRNENYSEYLSNSKSISRNNFFYFANDKLEQYFAQLTIQTDHLISDLSQQIKRMQDIQQTDSTPAYNKSQSTTILPQIVRNSSETRMNQRNDSNTARPRSFETNKLFNKNNSQQIMSTEPSSSIQQYDHQKGPNSNRPQYGLKRDNSGQNFTAVSVKSLLNTLNNSNTHHHPVMQRNAKSYKTVKFDRNQMINNQSKLNLNDCILLLDYDNTKKPKGNYGMNSAAHPKMNTSQNLNDSLLSQDNHDSNMPMSPFKDTTSKNNTSFSLLRDLHPVDNSSNPNNSQIRNGESQLKPNTTAQQFNTPQQNNQPLTDNNNNNNNNKNNDTSPIKTQQQNSQNQNAAKSPPSISLPVYKIRDIQKETEERNKPKEDWVLAAAEDVPDIKQLTEGTDKQIGEFEYILPTDHVEQDCTSLPIMKNITSGHIYNGQWKEGLRHGKGLCILKDGSVYVGYWKNNFANGYGRIIHPNQNIYEGDWLNGKAHGRGVYYYPNGTKYEGEWFEDQYDGYGVKTWNQGSKYQGYYRKGYRDGKGIFTWPDGSNYNGYFYKNTIHGFGHYKWKDGREYKGEWSNGKMNGHGWFRWPDDRIYEGNYFNDKKEGYGVFYWPNNEKTYQGYWQNDQPHGIGCITQQNGQKTKGEWQEGKHIRWIPESEDTSALDKQIKQQQEQQQLQQQQLQQLQKITGQK